MRYFELEKEPPTGLVNSWHSSRQHKERTGVVVRSTNEHGSNSLKRHQENLRNRRWLWDRKGGFHHSGERQRNESPVTGFDLLAPRLHAPCTPLQRFLSAASTQPGHSHRGTQSNGTKNERRSLRSSDGGLLFYLICQSLRFTMHS